MLEALPADWTEADERALQRWRSDPPVQPWHDGHEDLLRACVAAAERKHNLAILAKVAIGVVNPAVGGLIVGLESALRQLGAGPDVLAEIETCVYVNGGAHPSNRPDDYQLGDVAAPPFAVSTAPADVAGGIRRGAPSRTRLPPSARGVSVPAMAETPAETSVGDVSQYSGDAAPAERLGFGLVLFAGGLAVLFGAAAGLAWWLR